MLQYKKSKSVVDIDSYHRYLYSCILLITERLVFDLKC